MELDREAEMGQEGATGMELVQRSHNHILTTPRWGARYAPRAALGTSGRSLPESPQQPSDAPFQRRERRGRPCSARSPRLPAEGAAAAERPTLPDAGCRWRPRGAATRGAARAGEPVPGLGQDDLLAGAGGRSRLALLHRHQVADIGQHGLQVRHVGERRRRLLRTRTGRAPAAAARRAPTWGGRPGAAPPRAPARPRPPRAPPRAPLTAPRASASRPPRPPRAARGPAHAPPPPPLPRESAGSARPAASSPLRPS